MLTAHLTQAGAAEGVVEDFAGTVGGLDALVNTVGLCEMEPDGILAQDIGFWDRAYQSVLLASVRTCRTAVPLILANGGGAIVNTSAMSSRQYLPMMSHYSAMKAALGHFTKNLAREFGARGIRANAVLPGMIESEGVARRTLAAIDCVRRGAVLPLQLPLDDPAPGVVWRAAPKHRVLHVGHEAHGGASDIDRPQHGYVNRDDCLDGLWLQGSSQWDGLTHIRHPEHGNYNGVPDTDVHAGPGAVSASTAGRRAPSWDAPS